MAGTLGMEELSGEMLGTRRPQPTSPTSSSACGPLLCRVNSQSNSAGELLLSQIYRGGNGGGFRGLHSFPSSSESEGVDTSLLGPPMLAASARLGL